MVDREGVVHDPQVASEHEGGRHVEAVDGHWQFPEQGCELRADSEAAGSARLTCRTAVGNGPVRSSLV